jgi:oxalate decarboxylase/phosphoglucose isomerase-like protein (cupin superfamily)
MTDEITPGEASQLQFEVSRDDHPVGTLDEYLGALGHLVAIREGDLAYLHVHPEETDPGSGLIQFMARFPTVGRYRLFLQAKPNGTLITTSFDIHLEDKSTS